MMTNNADSAQKSGVLLPEDYREWTPQQIKEADSKQMPKTLGVGEWSFNQITAALSRQLPDNLLGHKNKGGTALSFIPWYLACDILDKYAPGWDYDTEVIPMADRVIVKATITIAASDRTVSRSSTGEETLKQMANDGTLKLTQAKQVNADGTILTQDYQPKEHAYGSPVTNAEGQALRRAASKFGLGRYLYIKTDG